LRECAPVKKKEKFAEGARTDGFQDKKSCKGKVMAGKLKDPLKKGGTRQVRQNPMHFKGDEVK